MTKNITFDLNQTDLEKLNTNSKALLYVDRKGQVRVDQDKSVWGRIVRAFSSAFCVRTYDLSHVLRAFSIASKDQPQIDLAKRNITYIRGKIAKQSGLKRDDFEELEAMESLLGAKTPIQDAVTKVEAFLERTAGNTKFNEALGAYAERAELTDKVSQKAVSIMRAYSHKMKAVKVCEGLIAKVDNIDNVLKTDANHFFSDDEKLTPDEVRELESLDRFFPTLESIAEMGVSEKGPFGQMKKNAELAQAFLNKILDTAEKQAPHKPGTIIAYDVLNGAHYSNKVTQGFREFVFRGILRTPIFHVALGIHDPETDQDLECHMWGTPRSVYTRKRRSLSSRCFKSISFKTSKFFQDEEVCKRLHTLYGDNWQTLLEQRYAKIEHAFLTNDKELKKLDNPSCSRFLKAFAARYSLLVRPWDKNIGFGKNQVSCSEFALKTLLQCMKTLEKELQEEWAKHSGQQDPGPKQFIYLDPFVNKRRILNTVLPHQLVEKAIKRGAAVVEEDPQIIRQIIKKREIKLPKDKSKSKKSCSKK